MKRTATTAAAPWWEDDATVERLGRAFSDLAAALRSAKTRTPARPPVRSAASMLAAGGTGLKAAPAVVGQAPPRFDPSVGRPGYRELRLGAPELDGPVWIAGERMARWAARDLGLGLVSVVWCTDYAGAPDGFAHHTAPNRFWIRASAGLTPEEAARRVAHEAKHLSQFRAGHVAGDPGRDVLLEEDAHRYAQDALSRFSDEQHREGSQS